MEAAQSDGTAKGSTRSVSVIVSDVEAEHDTTNGTPEYRLIEQVDHLRALKNVLLMKYRSGMSGVHGGMKMTSTSDDTIMRMNHEWNASGHPWAETEEQASHWKESESDTTSRHHVGQVVTDLHSYDVNLVWIHSIESRLIDFLIAID
jgi:hypothetical protein